MPKFSVMTSQEVLGLLRSGTYRVDVETGGVFGRKGEPVTPYASGSKGYLFVRLYAVIRGQRKTKTIAVQRLVWMAATGEPIPAGFEVHHEDEEVQSNGFENLLCLHRLDHRKKHRASEEPVPF